MSKLRTWTGDEMANRPNKDIVAQAKAIVNAIRPILFGKHPASQLIALAELVGNYLYGYTDPTIRREMQHDFEQAVALFLEMQAERRIPTEGGEGQ